jgi:hypothetical protein
LMTTYLSRIGDKIMLKVISFRLETQADTTRHFREHCSQHEGRDNARTGQATIE